MVSAAADRPSSRLALIHHKSDDTTANGGSRALALALDCLPALPVLLLGLFLACSLALPPRRRQSVHGGDLAFVAFAYADLAALFWCARRAERLAEAEAPSLSSSSSDGTRWRLQVAVWVLSTALSFAFAYRVSLILPSVVLVIVVWAMASSVVLVGFYVLVLCGCKDQGRYCLLEAVGDGEDGGLVDDKKSGAGGGELV